MTTSARKSTGVNSYIWERTGETMGIETLFDQVKDIHILGPRLNGEPEIVHEIEDYYRSFESFPIIRDQIRVILENVPKAFPETWKSPESYDALSPEQKKAYVDIMKAGISACPGPVIQRVIELAIEYRARYGKMPDATGHSPRSA